MITVAEGSAFAFLPRNTGANAATTQRQFFQCDCFQGAGLTAREAFLACPTFYFIGAEFIFKPPANHANASPLQVPGREVAGFQLAPNFPFAIWNPPASPPGK